MAHNALYLAWVPEPLNRLCNDLHVERQSECSVHEATDDNTTRALIIKENLVVGEAVEYAIDRVCGPVLSGRKGGQEMHWSSGSDVT